MEDGARRAEAIDRTAALTAGFYRWEMRGRGWMVWPDPVELEPPFDPYQHRIAPSRFEDDARTTSWFQRWLASMFSSRADPPDERELQNEDPTPALARVFELVEFQVALPPDVKVSPEQAEQLLVALSATVHPVSFEVLGTSENISVQLACSIADAPNVRGQVLSCFPDSVLTDTQDFLSDRWESSGEGSLVVDFGLSEEFMRPLKTVQRFEVDPLIAVVGAIHELALGEVAVLQVLFQGARENWASNVLRSVTDLAGDPFFIDAPELVTLAREKVDRPLFAAVVRIGVRGLDVDRSWQIARRLGAALSTLAKPPSNSLIALDNDDYPDDAHEFDLVERRTRRSGFLVSSAELVALVHLPSASVRSPKLARTSRRTKAAPRVAPGPGIVLGNNTHAGVTNQVTLRLPDRLRHMHVVGASGTGKSTFLLSLIAQDIDAGRGLALLDPHGDLVDEVLARIPESRTKDVILVDPADLERPIPFNILSAHSDLEKTLLASDLVSVFRRLSTSWGDQMTSVLSNAVLAFLESSRAGTLSDLRRFLVEAEFRSGFLGSVADREVVYFWEKEFPLLTGRPQAPLLTRLDAFLRPRLVRAMVGRTQNRLDFASIMDDGKILLVKLAQGAIGEENAALLGSLFVAKIHQLALGRQAVAEADRRPFYLYIDEFQHFVTASMATLLTSARKYRIGLILAHQELRQLWNQNKDVAGAVMANAATRVCFRVGDDDAKTLEASFSAFDARDLQNLGVGQAICRLDRADQDLSLDTRLPPVVPPLLAEQRRSDTVRSSRERYGVALATSNVEPIPGSLQEGASEVPVSPPNPTRRERPIVPATAAPAEVPKGGRGGAQHKYWQELIRRWGEANGWRATIEQPVLDGLGQIDVALERQGIRVACEVSVSSTVEYEVANVRKGLGAGFSDVVVVVVDSRARHRLRERLAEEGVGAESSGSVRVVSPEDVFDVLGSLANAGASTTTVAGYAVTVRQRANAPRPAHKHAVTQTIMNALKRLRTSRDG